LSQIPNATSGKGAIIVTTYSGSTNLGTKTLSYTLNAPSTVVPTLTDISLSEAVSAVSTVMGAGGNYVQNQSKIAWNMLGVGGVYGSTITGYKLTVSGKTYNTISGTTEALTSSGTLSVIATVTDSRGRTKTFTKTITVAAWAPPRLTERTVYRSNSSGTADPNGIYIAVNLAASVSSLVNSTQKNSIRYLVDTKSPSGTTWTNRRNTLAGNVTSTNPGVFVISGTYAQSSAFDVRVSIQDAFATTVSQLQVPTSTVTMDWGNGTVGVGKFWENGTLDVGGDIYAKAGNNQAGNINADGYAQFGDGVAATLVSDWNLALRSGFYYSNTTAALNAPTATLYFGMVLSYSNVYAVQTVWRRDELSRHIHYQRYFDGTTWSAWNLQALEWSTQAKASGMTDETTAGPIGYRRSAGLVHWRGGVVGSFPSGSEIAVTSTSISSLGRPTEVSHFPVVFNGGDVGYAKIGPTGALVVKHNTGVTKTSVFLTGVSFPAY
jgi:hypothetical protein